MIHRSVSLTITVIVPTHNPHDGRLRRTLGALRGQTLPPAQWETILLDNASVPAVDANSYADEAPGNLRLVREPRLGLTAARRRGFREAKGDFIILVDDDNVLAPDYLEQALSLMRQRPQLGAIGGRSLPEFESEPPAWTREFHGLLACRDLGPREIVAESWWDATRGRNEYPPCSPIGAGMVLRAAALQPWLDADNTAISDRRGDELTSGGDNDIVMTLLEHGWHVGYFPALALTHLIPAGRVQRDYLARLNRGIAKSWIHVLTRHAACPWGPIPAWTVPLRMAKAWLTYRAWRSPSAYVRWQGACGHFAGRAGP